MSLSLALSLFFLNEWISGGIIDPACSSTSAHLSPETGRFPGRSFMSPVPPEHAAEGRRGEPAKGSPSRESRTVWVCVCSRTDCKQREEHIVKSKKKEASANFSVHRFTVNLQMTAHGRGLHHAHFVGHILLALASRQDIKDRRPHTHNNCTNPLLFTISNSPDAAFPTRERR